MPIKLDSSHKIRVAPKSLLEENFPDRLKVMKELNKMVFKQALALSTVSKAEINALKSISDPVEQFEQVKELAGLNTMKRITLNRVAEALKYKVITAKEANELRTSSDVLASYKKTAALPDKVITAAGQKQKFGPARPSTPTIDTGEIVFDPAKAA